MILLHLEYCTVVSVSSRKSVTQYPGGYYTCVIRLQSEVFLGINPMRELLRFEIGRKLKDPAILPRVISCSTLSYAAT